MIQQITLCNALLNSFIVCDCYVTFTMCSDHVFQHNLATFPLARPRLSTLLDCWTTNYSIHWALARRKKHRQIVKICMLQFLSFVVGVVYFLAVSVIGSCDKNTKPCKLERVRDDFEKEARQACAPHRSLDLWQIERQRHCLEWALWKSWLCRNCLTTTEVRYNQERKKMIPWPQSCLSKHWCPPRKVHHTHSPQNTWHKKG